MELAGKTFVLTGASGGIGHAIAHRLSRAGIHLVLVGRNKNALDILARELPSPSTPVTADLTTTTGIQTVREACQALPHGVDGLINNAGTSLFALFDTQRADEMEQQIRTNLLAPMHLTHALLPLLMNQGEARIVNIGSTFGSIGYPGFTSYCASKFGLRGFSESLGRELSDTRIRVQYLAPRATQTAINSDAVNQLNQTLGNQSDPPERVADALLALLQARNITQRFIGFPEKLFARINQLLPSLVDNALKKQLATIKSFARR